MSGSAPTLTVQEAYLRSVIAAICEATNWTPQTCARMLHEAMPDGPPTLREAAYSVIYGGYKSHAEIRDVLRPALEATPSNPINVLAAPSSEHRPSKPEDGASRTSEDTDAHDLRAMGDMILLCGEEECRDVKGYAAKLRALIDGLIDARAALERAIDTQADKILAMTDDQVKALCRIEGHDPDDEATIVRQIGEIVILKHDVERLNALINSPETEDFDKGVPLECAHQVERWGEAHDRSKSAENWFWLVGYLGGKALRACITGDREKALHHTISAGAALRNWHKAIKRDTTGAGIGQDPDLVALDGGEQPAAVAITKTT